MATPERALARTDAKDDVETAVRPTRAYWVLLLVLVCDAFGTSLARLTLDAGMPPLVITGLRLPLAWLLFTPIVWRRYRQALRTISPQDWALTIVAGISFNAQLILIFIAIDNTSIMIVHVMFSTTLLWVAAMERVFLNAKLHRLVMMGLFLAFLGSLIIGVTSAEEPLAVVATHEAWVSVFDDVTAGNTSLWGAIAGMLGAAIGAGYMVIGRKVRRNVDAAPYLWGVYGSGMIFSTIALIATRTPVMGYDVEAYFWLFLLFLVVQLGIHSGISYIVGYLPATFVSISGQITTFTASVTAFFLFHETPHAMEVVGGLVIIMGIILAILGQRENRPTGEDSIPS